MQIESVSGSLIDVIDIYDKDWPPKPQNFRSLTPDERSKKFGSFTFVADIHNAGMIKIVSATNFKISVVDVDQLVKYKVKGVNKTGRVWMNKNIVDNFLKLFRDWEEAGLLDLVRTFDGGFVPRYVRGSTTTLSNHSWGTAFDINAKWNPLGKTPTLVGEEGSVRQLVEIAEKNDFYWLGWGKRPDGMHFEAGIHV